MSLVKYSLFGHGSRTVTRFVDGYKTSYNTSLQSYAFLMIQNKIYLIFF